MVIFLNELVLVLGDEEVFLFFLLDTFIHLFDKFNSLFLNLIGLILFLLFKLCVKVMSILNQNDQTYLQ